MNWILGITLDHCVLKIQSEIPILEILSANSFEELCLDSDPLLSIIPPQWNSNPVPFGLAREPLLQIVTGVTLAVISREVTYGKREG